MRVFQFLLYACTLKMWLVHHVLLLLLPTIAMSAILPAATTNDATLLLASNTATTPPLPPPLPCFNPSSILPATHTNNTIYMYSFLYPHYYPCVSFLPAILLLPPGGELCRAPDAAGEEDAGGVWGRLLEGHPLRLWHGPQLLPAHGDVWECESHTLLLCVAKYALLKSVSHTCYYCVY